MHPKRPGSSVEAAVIDANSAVELVSDTTAGWCGARTAGLLTPSTDRPFIGICVVESETPVEIKGTIPETNMGQAQLLRKPRCIRFLRFVRNCVRVDPEIA